MSMPMPMRSVMMFAFSLALALAAGTARGAVPARLDADTAALACETRVLPTHTDPASLRLVEEDVDGEGDNDNTGGGEGKRSELLTPPVAVPPSATLLADDEGSGSGGDGDGDDDGDERVAAPGSTRA